MIRAILVDPFGCEIRFVLMHGEHQQSRQVYRYVRAAPITGVLLPNGDTVWYAEHGLTDTGNGQCYFAMPTLIGNLAVGGCCVITGQGQEHCASTLDDIDAAVQWLAEPVLDGDPPA